MLPKDYIAYRLTGVHCTDVSDASGMLLFDVKNRCWSKEMCEICGVREEQLATCYESYEKVGCVLPEVADELGIPANVVVAAGAGDNAAAAVGTGTVGDNMCNISLGTSGTIFISSTHFGVDQHNALHSFAHADGHYHLMGCMLSAASCNNGGWMRSSERRIMPQNRRRLRSWEKIMSTSCRISWASVLPIMIPMPEELLSE